MPTTGIRAGADSSNTRLSLAKETAWGVTPTSPAFTNLRFTSESLQPAKETTRSNEIRPDRNVVDEILVGRSVSGSLDFELSYGAFDDLIESLMFAEWAGTPANTIKNGAGNGQSFTAERTLKLPDGTSHYTRFLGLVVNSMSLNISSGELVTGSFDVMGKFGSAGTTALSGATYADAPQNRVINAATHFASFAVAGIAQAPIVRSITLNITNNLREQRAVGSVDNIGMGTGRYEVTGSVEAYFKSGALLDAFLAHSDLGLDFTLGTEATKRYRFLHPTVVPTGSPGGNAGGNDDDVMQTFEFTAVLDRTSGTPIGATTQITRAV